jgi:formiminoglutamase
MYSKPNPQLWSGRVDAQDGELGKHWHEKIEFLEYPYEQKSGVALLGFECDEGVKRNKGRVGARYGSDELKKAMGCFAWHFNSKLYDCGKVITDKDLKISQEELALHVRTLLKNNHFPIVLGGGHEVAFGSFMGTYNHLKAEIAIINFDAHFDLRESDEATSGTPFAQIASTCKEFNYLCLGISKAANTKALFKKVEDLNVEYILDTKMIYMYISEIKSKLNNFLKQKEYIYISIDTDVFPAYQVPAVSAMASRGVEIGLVYEILEYLFENYKDKIKIVDIAEYNPKYDINDIGKKTVSRMIYDIVELYNR